MMLSHLLGYISMVVVLSVISTAATGANVVPITDGNELLAQCKKSILAYENADSKLSSDLAVAISCDSYVCGFDDAHRSFIEILAVKKHGYGKWTTADSKELSLYCTSDGITIQQMERVIVQYLENHLDKLQRPAGILTTLALRKAFPCK